MTRRKLIIANVIRSDNGQNDLASDYDNTSYSTLLLGTSASIPPDLVIPPDYRIDVSTASDDQVLQAVASLMHAYLDSLRFSTDSNNQYNGSPYDVFLAKNSLPRQPDPGESNIAYSQRLLGLIQQLSKPAFVTQADAPASASNGKPEFQLHNQHFAFGATELQGLKVFFSQSGGSGSAHVGNCVACHTAPNFADFRFHNTGASQIEYDAIFGQGAFAALTIPDPSTRNANFDQYLPPSANHPNASGLFRSPASASRVGYTDLGVWNIVDNPDLPTPQTALHQILCPEFNLGTDSCDDNALLPLTAGYFKTPTLRDLGQSSPYLHNGLMNTITDVLNFYVNVSQLARAQQLRSASPELSDIFIDQSDVTPLSAFIQALNEDYD